MIAANVLTLKAEPILWKCNSGYNVNAGRNERFSVLTLNPEIYLEKGPKSGHLCRVPCTSGRKEPRERKNLGRRREHLIKHHES
jgi:hypothetical protein